jgi:PTS system nitrogen regulatory IIA component
VIPELAARNKQEVLQELSAAMASANPTLNREHLVFALREREKLSSTGIGEGIAIPHAKLSELTHLLASFGVSHAGIDFDAIDGKPTHLFFALIAPENSAGIHLKALARISRLFKSAQFRTAIMQAKTADEIYTLVAREDGRA